MHLRGKISLYNSFITKQREEISKEFDGGAFLFAG